MATVKLHTTRTPIKVARELSRDDRALERASGVPGVGVFQRPSAHIWIGVGQLLALAEADCGGEERGGTAIEHLLKEK